MPFRPVAFVAIILTALALVPGGAHLASMPNKMHLGRDAYFITQSAYNGWALFGVAIFAALAADVLLAVTLRQRRLACLCAAAAALLLVLTLGVFFTWTQPANAATANWTQMPDNWEALRVAWEYSHAVNAMITFLALCLTTAATLLRR